MLFRSMDPICQSAPTQPIPHGKIITVCIFINVYILSNIEIEKKSACACISKASNTLHTSTFIMTFGCSPSQ